MADFQPFWQDFKDFHAQIATYEDLLWCLVEHSSTLFYPFSQDTGAGDTGTMSRQLGDNDEETNTYPTRVHGGAQLSGYHLRLVSVLRLTILITTMTPDSGFLQQYHLHLPLCLHSDTRRGS